MMVGSCVELWHVFKVMAAHLFIHNNDWHFSALEDFQLIELNFWFNVSSECCGSKTPRLFAS